MRSISRLLITTLLLGCLSLSASAQKSIVVFFDNDVHCNIDGYKYIAGLRNSVSADTAYVALVSSGDYTQGGSIGAISKGEAIMTILKEARYDAIALGNHEFDYGAHHTYSLMKSFDAPVVCCNYKDSKGETVFKPYRICQYGDKRVAYIGVTTPNTLYSTKASAFQDLNGHYLYDFSRYDLYDVVQKTVDEARAEHADYVVVLSHLGESSDSIGVSSHDLIAKTRGIDVLLDGHTHNVVQPTCLKNAGGEDVLIAQTGTQFANIGKLIIGSDGRISAELIPCYLGNMAVLTEDAHVAHVVDSIMNFYEKVTGLPVGHCAFDLSIYDAEGNTDVRRRETNAGDLVADAIRLCAKADVAMVNGGAIRNECQAGNLKRGDIIAMCPYDNDVCSMEITGQQLEKVLNSSIQYLPLMHGNFPQVSGVSFKVNLAGIGHNYVTDVKVFDQKRNKYRRLRKRKTYKFATTIYFIGTDQFKALDNQFDHYCNYHTLYSQAVIDLVQDYYKGEVPNSYRTADSRIIF